MMRLSPLLFLAAIAALAAPVTARDNAPRIVALGDSLTSGRGIGKADAYPAVLQERIVDNGYTSQMINAGVSGATTGRAVRRFQDALARGGRRLVLAVGAHGGPRDR